MLQSICLSPQAQEGSGGKVYKPARLAGAAASLVASPEAPWRWLGGGAEEHSARERTKLPCTLQLLIFLLLSVLGQMQEFKRHPLPSVLPQVRSSFSPYNSTHDRLSVMSPPG